ncbi:MAG: RnfABCDGE type electron transport complex subunit G [Deferribacteraceae bacterium]|jgi:electron transport complex protein RnfG|nr:RnfABCDGE type electron transport complex subunit G [Deferribacteraceae bacterium]
MRNDIIRYALTLSVIALLSALLMAFVYGLTKPAIDEARRQDFLIGLNAVLPEYDNSPDLDAIIIDNQSVYVAKKGGAIVGYAAVGHSPKGYGGTVSVIVGALADSTISGVVVVKHTETPGLGDRIITAAFLSIFEGSHISREYAVKADGGHVDQFSGATISPRAVCDAVNTANALLVKGLEYEY